MITDLNKVKNAEELAAGVGTVIPAESQEILSGNHSETLQEKRTPEQIGAEIRMYVNTGRWITTLCAIEIGRRLVEAKELLTHGEWLPWLKKETEFSERSAQDYMRVFKDYSASQLGMFGPETNTQTFADLPFSKALALLSVPESEREAFAKEVDAEHISVQNLKKAIKEREAQVEALKKDVEGERIRGDEAIRAKTEAEDLLKTQDQMLVEARAQIEELAKLNKELENRPHEVAVETVRDEEAIAAAAKEAREKAAAAAQASADRKAKEYEKKIADLEKKLNKAENERAEAVKKAETAGSDTDAKIAEAEAEAARIRTELEEAQKKLKASSADVAKFGVWFTQVQNDFNRMMEALREVNERDPETGEKLKRGAVTLLKNQVARLGPEEE